MIDVLNRMFGHILSVFSARFITMETENKIKKTISSYKRQQLISRGHLKKKVEVSRCSLMDFELSSKKAGQVKGISFLVRLRY